MTTEAAPPQGALCRLIEVERRLGLSRKTVYRRVDDGTIPTVIIAGVRRVPRSWLERQLKEIERAASI